MSGERAGGIGSKLRDARERKGMTLREIANRTKISIAVLEALERNDISRLPGGIFSRAFVRSYANEVGLDAEAAIQDFIAQFPQDSVVAGHPRSDRVEDTEAFESDRRVARSILWMVLISVPLAGVVMYLGVWRGHVDADSSGEAAASVETQPPAKAADEPSSAGANVTAPPPAAEPPTAVPASLPPPVPASIVAPAARDASAAASPEDRLTIALSARRPVFISATVDGKKTIGRLLQTGEQETIEVRKEMVITAGDAAALKMTLNGSEARALGKSGEVVTARLTLANFKEYLQSR